MEDALKEVRKNGSKTDNTNKNIVKANESRVTVNVLNLNVNDIYFKQILKVLLRIEKLLIKMAR